MDWLDLAPRLLRVLGRQSTLDFDPLEGYGLVLRDVEIANVRIFEFAYLGTCFVLLFFHGRTVYWPLFGILLLLPRVTIFPNFQGDGSRYSIAYIRQWYARSLHESGIIYSDFG